MTQAHHQLVRRSDPVTPTPRALSNALPLLEKELVRAHRVANDSLQREDLEWLCKGFSAFLANSGRVPLERCLHLPTNERALGRARRDHCLRRAWLELSAELSPWRRSELLAQELQRFQGGKWVRWCDLEQAPVGISAFDEALFDAFRSHDRMPSTAMQLHNIAGLCRER